MAKVMTMIRMDDDLKEEFKKLAEKERRSLSNFLINAAIQYSMDYHDINLRVQNPKKSKK
jgi:predicted transcriptional regulator